MRKPFVLSVMSVLAVACSIVYGQVQVKPIQVIGRPVRLGYQSQDLKMLQSKSVQKDLGLSDMQSAQIEELAKEFAETMKKMAANRNFRELRQLREKTDAKIEQLLTKKQATRLEQIQLQNMSPYQVINNPKVKAKLNIDNAKRAKMFQVIRQKQQEIQREINRKVMEEFIKTLPADQQKEFRKILGKEFKGKLPTSGVRFEVRPLQGRGAVRPRVNRLPAKQAPQKKEQK